MGISSYDPSPMEALMAMADEAGVLIERPNLDRILTGDLLETGSVQSEFGFGFVNAGETDLETRRYRGIGPRGCASSSVTFA